MSLWAKRRNHRTRRKDGHASLFMRKRDRYPIRAILLDGHAAAHCTFFVEHRTLVTHAAAWIQPTITYFRGCPSFFLHLLRCFYVRTHFQGQYSRLCFRVPVGRAGVGAKPKETKGRREITKMRTQIEVRVIAPENPLTFFLFPTKDYHSATVLDFRALCVPTGLLKAHLNLTLLLLVLF